MSLNNDYLVGIIVRQRLSELQSEAANNRLAHLAQGDQTRPWPRLVGRLHRRRHSRRSQHPYASPCPGCS